MTDDQMDDRLHAAGARWREANPVATAPALADIEITRAALPHRPRTWIAALTGAAVVAAAVIIGVAVTRGNDGSPQPAGQTELAGTSWVLVAPSDANIPKSPQVVTLAFTDDGKVGGTDGCNSFGGSVDIGADTLHFGNLYRTEIGCPATQGSADQIDRVFVGDVHWTITSGRLILSKAGAGVLSYLPKPAIVTSTDPAKLIGVTWGLSGVEHDSGNSASGSGSSDTTVIRLTFDGSGGFGVAGQCGFKGRVVAGPGVATFPASELAYPSCPPGVQGTDSVAVHRVLIGETTWSIVDGTLTITKGSTKLTFTDHPSSDPAATSSGANPPATSLLGSSWLLADVNSPTFAQTLDPKKTPLKLTFDAKGVVGIDDGVNFHSPENEQPIEISADIIDFGQLTSTAVGCAPVGTAAQNCTRSNVIAAFFSGKVGWAIHSGQLTLTKGSTTLVYVRG